MSLIQTANTDSRAVAEAVIYTRISSVAQSEKGHGLQSQETRCREFARMKGYPVAQVFSDRAVSGGIVTRPGMQAMLAYIEEHTDDDYIILIDDISRLARDMKAHLDLRDAIASVGARLESPSIEFGEDSDSILVENLLASVSQHQRQKNAEQTKNRMRARLQNGYWPHPAPLGYRHVAKSGQGKVLVRDEPLASVIQEAMEGYASGRFQLQAEVKRFLQNQPAFPKNRYGNVTDESANRILTRVLYSGMVESPGWNVSLRKGQHDGLVSFETFEKIQNRLKEGAMAPARADINTDFVLRGSVTCACCDHPMTACWSKSKTGKKHPYYMCFKKGCPEYRKSIKRDKIEGALSDLLEGLHPAQGLLDMSLAMFKKVWEHRLMQGKAIAQGIKRDLTHLDSQIDNLLDRIVDAHSPSVVSAYEKRIAKLERQRLIFEEKQATCAKPKGAFEDVFELALRFPSNPHKLWNSGRFECQKLVLKLAFTDKLSYSRNEGFRTPQVAVPFRFLGNSAEINKMSERQRFELWVGYKPTAVFKTAAFNHSATSPRAGYDSRFTLN